MPAQMDDTGTPLDWLRHAKSDLLLAGIEPPKGVMLETLCYHAQQTVEKSLKAVLLSSGVRFPYTQCNKASWQGFLKGYWPRKCSCVTAIKNAADHNSKLRGSGIKAITSCLAW